MQWTIYALSDPRTNTVRYVGMTTRDLTKRLGEHIAQSKLRQKTRKAKWIYSLVKDGVAPTISFIESGAGDTWRSAERRWITFYRDNGTVLVNGTDGGDGAPGYSHPPETRAQIAMALRGRKQSEEHRMKNTIRQIGKRPSDACLAAAAATRTVPWIAARHPHKAYIKPKMRKLTITEVEEIRAARGIISQKELARKYDIDPSTISRIYSGLRYST